MRGFGWQSINCPQDVFKDAFDVLQYIVVPEAQYEISAHLQIPGSARILFGLSGVLPAIKFDHKLGIRATKVDDKSIERHLSPKLQAAEPTIAQFEPQVTFGIGLMPAQATRDLGS